MGKVHFFDLLTLGQWFKIMCNGVKDYWLRHRFRHTEKRILQQYFLNILRTSRNFTGVCEASAVGVFCLDTFSE